METIDYYIPFLKKTLTIIFNWKSERKEKNDNIVGIRIYFINNV